MAYTVAKYSVDIEDTIGYARWVDLNYNAFIYGYKSELGTYIASDFLLAVF